jgi:serine/threonine protein kinase
MICIPLFFIHKNDIVHRDLKPDNILQKFIGDREIFLITDFGTSSKANTQFLTTVKKYTPFYASIEQLNDDKAHFSFDIWSLGIILYVLMAKKVPFPQFSDLKRGKAIQENQREKLSKDYSQSLRDLVDYCLTLD